MNKISKFQINKTGFKVFSLLAAISAFSPAVLADTVQEVAQSIDWGEGAPRYSDVPMRCLNKLDGSFPRKDENNEDVFPLAIPASKDFHITQIVWSYLYPSNNDAKNFISDFTGRGISFNLTSPIYVSSNSIEASLYGLKRRDNSLALRPLDTFLFGCRNNPFFRLYASKANLINLDKLPVPSGAVSFTIHQDDAHSQETASKYATSQQPKGLEGCFCEHCSSKFSSKCQVSGGEISYTSNSGIRTVVSTSILNELNFDLDKDKEAFILFARDSDEDYIQYLKNKVATYIKTNFNSKRLVMSTNGGTWDDQLSPDNPETFRVLKHYDYWLGEIWENNHNQKWFWRLRGNSNEFKKKIMPTSSFVFKKPHFRRIVAGCYAVGMTYIVPWDMYLRTSTGQNRLYSNKEDFADLYGFIRGVSRYLDDYEDAFGYGPKKEITDDRLVSVYGGTAPVKASGWSGEVYAFTRAKPNDTSAPVVVHLVDWGTPPDSAPTTSISVTLSRSRLFPGRRLAVQLLTPKPYDPSLHDRVESSKNYSELVNAVDLPVMWSGGDEVRVQVPQVTPWGLLVIRPLDDQTNNQLKNPGFEEASTANIPGWNKTGLNVVTTNSPVRGGAGALKITSQPNTSQIAWQDWMDYEPGNAYQLSFWGLLAPNQDLRGKTQVATIKADGTQGVNVAAIEVTEPVWTKYSMTFTTNADSAGLRIRCYESTNTIAGTIYFDDFTIATVTVPTSAPSAPTELSVVPGANALAVGWVAPAGSLVDSYKVTVSTEANFSHPLTGWSDKDIGNMTTVTVTGLEDYTTYYVRVKSSNRLKGNSIPSALVVARTLDTIPPTPPLLDSTSVLNTVYFTWGGSTDLNGSGVAGYKVDVSTESGFGSYLIGWENKDLGATTSATLEGLRGGTMYYARARAYDVAGNRSGNSEVKPQRCLGLVNPDFEETTGGVISGWQKTAGTNVGVSQTEGEHRGGTNGLKITATPGTWQVAWQEWKGYVPGSIYQLSFWGKVESSQGLRGLVNVATIKDGKFGTGVSGIYVTEPGWTKYSMTFSTNAASDGLWIQNYESTNTIAGTIYFDDFTIATVTVPTSAPSAPTELSVVPGANALAVGWVAPAGSLVDSYKVTVSTNETFVPAITGWSDKDIGNMTTATVTGLEDYTTYYVRVKSSNRLKGNSIPSALVVARTWDTIAPSQPQLDGIPHWQSLKLAWGGSTDLNGSGVSRYEVDLSSTVDFTGILEGWNNRDMGTSVDVNVEGLSGQTTYYARVRAYDVAGNFSGFSSVKELKVMGLINPGFEEGSGTGIAGWSTTTGANVGLTRNGTEILAGTSTLKITATPGTWQIAWQDWKEYIPNISYQLSFWGRVESTTGLRGRVQVATTKLDGSYGANVAYVDVMEPGWTKYSMTFSTNAAVGDLRIRCYETVNTLAGTIYFDDIVIASVTTPVTRPEPPSGLTIKSDQGALHLSWTAPHSVVDSYQVALSLTSDFKSLVTGWHFRDVGNMTSAHISGLNANTRYYAVVRAYNRVGGLSGVSHTANATTTGAVSVQSVERLSTPPAPHTLESVRAYPIPFRPGQGIPGITFDQLPDDISIKIFSIDGRIVNPKSSVALK